jgi:hypothetical protein
MMELTLEAAMAAAEAHNSAGKMVVRRPSQTGGRQSEVASVCLIQRGVVRGGGEGVNSGALSLIKRGAAVSC